MDSTVVSVLHIILGKPDFLQLATPWSELDFNDPHSVLACVIRGSAPGSLPGDGRAQHCSTAQYPERQWPFWPLHYESSLGNYKV